MGGWGGGRKNEDGGWRIEDGMGLETPCDAQSSILDPQALSHPPTHPTSHTFSNNNHATGFGIMCQLRPRMALENYLPTVRRMMQADGYLLIAVSDQGEG